MLRWLRSHCGARWLLSLLILAVSGCSAGGPAGGAGTEETRPVQLKVAAFYNPDVPILGTNIRNLASEVERASAGSIRMRVFAPGTLVGSLEILDAVSEGKVEAGYAAAGFWAGKVPAAPLFSSVPFGPEAPEFLSWLHAGNGMDLYQEMYDQAGFDVKVLVAAIIPPETSGWFAHPIESPEDLRGLKMRFYGLGGAVMRKLGVSVSVLPGGEIFPALEKGVIDATEFAMPVIDESYGFHKLVKYNYFPGWHQQSTTFELLIHKPVWESMSESQRAIIELACHATVVKGIADGEALQSAAMRRNEEERGVTNATWSPEMLDAFRSAWREVAKEESARDPFFAKAYADYLEFRKEYAIWREKAFLQR